MGLITLYSYIILLGMVGTLYRPDHTFPLGKVDLGGGGGGGVSINIVYKTSSLPGPGHFFMPFKQGCL